MQNKTQKPDTAKIPTELFHSYIVDSRGDCVNKSKSTSFITNEHNRIHFFCSDIEDPARTNSDACGYISNDDSFMIKSIRIGIKLSNRERLPDFLRATRFFLYVGDMPFSTIEANLLADTDAAHGVSYRQEPVVPTEFQVDLWAEKHLEHQIVIPPRQSFSVVMDTHNIFSNKMREIEEGKVKEYAEIRVTLCGTRITHNPKKIEEFIEEFRSDEKEDSCDHEPAGENPENPPFRGYGIPPRDGDPLDKFCENLLVHMKMLTHNGQRWSMDCVKMALTNTMSAFPMYRGKSGEFTIPAQADEQKPDPEAEFFRIDPEDGEPKKWDPMAYLKNRKKS
jgi:hypothetical protein